ncbi:AAA family ATPase [Dactylosporangium darangshiense]|uniref:NadR/Ttd14 AAA domain-containing protein n=1 Tax=Dactylosporangium darangshiense TaxID=579108 RepID=A0ABP8DG45_9ACTN
MRIGVAGAHGTGKTTLVEDLTSRHPSLASVPEPYVLLEEQGYEFDHPPSPADYMAQFRASLRLLRRPAARVVFDRTPLDFVAYLRASGTDLESDADVAALRSAMASLDLLVVVPITPLLPPPPDFADLRAAMNDALLDLVYDDEVLDGVEVLELHGPLDGRADAVCKALAL